MLIRGRENNRAVSGFTLLELVIALALLGLMAGILFGALRVATSAYERSQTRIESKARTRILQDLVRRQIGSLYPLRPTGAFLQETFVESEPTELPTATTGSAPDPVQSLSPLFIGEGESVTFTTVAPLLLTDHPGLTVVRYGLAEDENGQYYLGAMETPFTGISSFESMVNIPEGKPLAVVETLQELQFEYFGYDVASDTFEWTSYWDGEERLAVPLAIRIDFDDESLLVSINASGIGERRGSDLRNLRQR